MRPARPGPCEKLPLNGPEQASEAGPGGRARRLCRWRTPEGPRKADPLRAESVARTGKPVSRYGGVAIGPCGGARGADPKRSLKP
jgi:hypothetical protein